MLLEALKNYKLILASGSPRRQELMKSVGLEFKISSGTDVDESYPENLIGKEIPIYLAEKKSDAYPYPLDETDILVTADTIVYQDGEVLLKPNSEEEAMDTLLKIARNKHHVFTGVCIRSQKKKELFVADTEVSFGDVTKEEIAYYIQQYKPFDKAGAYGIQEWIGFVGVEEINGSYFNVMGLPIHMLYRKLEMFIK